VRISAWRGTGPILASTWLTVAIVTVLMLDAQRYSGADAVQSALNAALLLRPLAAGLAAAMTVRLLRPGLDDLVLSAPDAARVRRVMAPVVLLAGWALAGLLASVLACTLIAGLSGSWPAWPVYLAILPAAAGTLAVMAIGALLALVVRSWIVPPVAALATYLVYLLPWDAAHTMTAYISASPGAAAPMVPNLSTLTQITVAHLLLTVAASALAMMRLTTWRRFGVLAVGAGLAWVLVLALIGTGQNYYEPLPEKYWACTAVPGGNRELCLPGQQIRDLAPAAQALAGIDARVGASFDGAPLRYGPFSDGLRTLPVPVPIGNVSAYTQDAAQSIAGYVTSCAALVDHPGKAYLLDEKDFTRFYSYLGYLKNTDLVLPGQDPVAAMSVAQAQSLVKQARQQCPAR
jgi:hypothetical protein